MTNKMNTMIKGTNNDDILEEERQLDAATDELPNTLPGTGGLSAFASLVQVLGTSTKTLDKLAALSNYFTVEEDKDKVWVIAIFSGRRPRRAVNVTLLQSWCIELADIPAWLFAECYDTVGDLAETIALLLPDIEESAHKDVSLSYYLEELIRLEKQDELVKKEFIINAWKTMTSGERFVFNKFITGSFRIGVSQKMIVNA